MRSNAEIAYPEERKIRHQKKLEFIFNLTLLFLLVIVIVLAAAMAITSAYDHHPDERVHFEAVKYYSKNHWLPPEIGDPETLDSYSAFGKSRLNLPDYYYLIAGKFTALISIFTGNQLISARFFNVFLLSILVIMAFRMASGMRMIYGILLLTPQIWYIYSYVNADAFALFLTFMITAQLVAENSFFKQYLNSPSLSKGFFKSLPLILLVTLLYFTKENFYLYFIFLLIWGVWFLYTRKDRKQLIIKFAIMISIFLILILIKAGIDYSIYGPDKDDKLKEMQELTADADKKPSVRSIGEGDPLLNLKRRGVHYLELFKEPYNWHKGTFFTFCGTYDYMLIFGSANYYRLMLLLYIFLFIFLVIHLWKKGWEARYFVFSTIVLTIYILYLAFLFSWESAFQPQGRYLFPILGIVAYLFGRYGKSLQKQIIFQILLLATAVMSFYSFVAYGLMQIPKI